jgi:hypothetical protein
MHACISTAAHQDGQVCVDKHITVVVTIYVVVVSRDQDVLLDLQQYSIGVVTAAVQQVCWNTG